MQGSGRDTSHRRGHGPCSNGTPRGRQSVRHACVHALNRRRYFTCCGGVLWMVMNMAAVAVAVFCFSVVTFGYASYIVFVIASMPLFIPVGVYCANRRNSFVCPHFFARICLLLCLSSIVGHVAEYRLSFVAVYLMRVMPLGFSRCALRRSPYLKVVVNNNNNIRGQAMTTQQQPSARPTDN